MGRLPSKKTKKKSPNPATHPKYDVMIIKALTDLKDRNGSSQQALSKYIISNYDVPEEDMFKRQLKLGLRRALEKNIIEKVRASFKLTDTGKEQRKQIIGEEVRRSRSPKRTTKNSKSPNSKSPKRTTKNSKKAGTVGTSRNGRVKSPSPIRRGRSKTSPSRKKEKEKEKSKKSRSPSPAKSKSPKPKGKKSSSKSKSSQSPKPKEKKKTGYSIKFLVSITKTKK